jgi:hypothetical protein
MCPGGQVVAATSEEGRVVTNGMSQYSRAERNANAALVVEVKPEDFPGDYKTNPLAGIDFQRQWESAAFVAGGSNYAAPAQRIGDFLAGRPSTALGAVDPSYQPGVHMTDLASCAPPYVIEALREAIPAFDKQIRGFAMADAVLTGVETRTSSPIRIKRGADYQSINTRGLYPAGEGAGYARWQRRHPVGDGVDGIKVAWFLTAQWTRPRGRFGKTQRTGGHGFWGNDGNIELLCEPVTERTGTDFRYRQTAGGDDQRLAGEAAVVGGHPIALYGMPVVAFNMLDGALQGPFDAGVVAGIAQHGDDFLGRVVAEKLAVFALVVRNAPLFDHRDEIELREARQCRAAEVRVLRKVVLGADRPVGEIAAPATGNPNALAEFGRVVDQKHVPPPAPGLGRAHHAGSAGADDDDVKMHWAGSNEVLMRKRGGFYHRASSGFGDGNIGLTKAVLLRQRCPV